MTASSQPITSPEQLFTQWRRGMFLEAFRILHGTEDAEDCVQEAGLRIVRFWNTCNPETAPAWAFAIVRNQALDILRKRRVRTQETEEPFAKNCDPAIPSHEASIIARLTLAAAVARLTPQQAEAFALWVEGQRSRPAVGKTIYFRQWRTLGRLRNFCRC